MQRIYYPTLVRVSGGKPEVLSRFDETLTAETMLGVYLHCEDVLR